MRMVKGDADAMEIKVHFKMIATDVYGLCLIRDVLDLAKGRV